MIKTKKRGFRCLNTCMPTQTTLKFNNSFKLDWTKVPKTHFPVYPQLKFVLKHISIMTDFPETVYPKR